MTARLQSRHFMFWRHVGVHVVLATSAAIADDWGWSIVCWSTQLLFEWVLRDTRRVERARALRDFEEELHEHADRVCKAWLREKQRERPVLIHSELDGKGGFH